VSQGIFKRIEAQFRIIDLDLTDQLVPAGLTTMMVDIKLFPPEAGTLDRALLSRFETAQAGSTPPASVDCSGLPTNAFGASTGIHRPYRGGIGPPAPGNNNPVNGTLGPGQINGILPFSLSQNDQAHPPSPTNPGFYGLYSFAFQPALNFSGLVVITVRAVPDAMTGNAFAFYSDGDPIPHASATAAAGSISIEVPGGTPTVCCASSICVLAASAQACTNIRGRGSPGTACQPDFCCLGDFNVDGHVGVQDVFDYVAAYLRRDPTANVFQPTFGAIDLNDLFAFLTAFFRGCS